MTITYSKTNPIDDHIWYISDEVKLKHTIPVRNEDIT